MSLYCDIETDNQAIINNYMTSNCYIYVLTAFNTMK